MARTSISIAPAAPPHQLTGLYATDSTCSSKSGKVYASTYDAWGNVTSRTIGGTTATLSYDDLDHFVEWNSPNSSPATQEWYAYDASGNRALRRSTSGSTTTQTTSFFLTDGLGSILATFSNTVNTAAVLGNQVYGPYGTGRYQSGSMGTNKGFTGQYNDSTGLDYYNARYYDPSVGVFLSADVKQGNMQGMNPYDYVGGNPETHNDPTGNYYSNGTSLQQHNGAIGYVYDNIITTEVNDGYGTSWSLSGQETWNTNGGISFDSSTVAQIATYGGYNPITDPNNSPGAKFARVTGWDTLQQSWNAPGATWQSRLAALGKFGLTNANNVFQLAMILGGGPEEEGIVAADETATVAADAEKAMEGATSQDLYRQGGINAGPNLGYARPGKEAIDGIVSSDKGTSLWSEMFAGENKPQGWWQLPAGTPIPDGFRIVSTGIINGVEHWEFRPIVDMTVDAFQQGANSVIGWLWMGKL